MNEKEIARKLYTKIEFALTDKKISRLRMAKDLKISKSYIADLLLNLKMGKLISLRYLLRIQEYLKISLIFFDI